MKKALSFILIISLCTGMLCLLSSCGGEVSNKDFNRIEEAFGDSAPGQIDKDNISVFVPDGVDENADTDNSIYNDETDDIGFIINNDNGATVNTSFVVKNALYKDVDGDGVDEVYASGYIAPINKTRFALYDYTENLLKYEGSEDMVMQLIASDDVDGNHNIGFYEDESGNVHVCEMDAGTKAIVKEFGVATCNGLLLETSENNCLSKATDSPDMSIFITDSYRYFFNGKEFTPDDDFAWNDGSMIPPISYVEKSQFEKVTGAKYKSLGDKLDARSLMVIYDKQYVSWFTLMQNYDINVELRDAQKKDEDKRDIMWITTPDYVEPAQ